MSRLVFLLVISCCLCAHAAGDTTTTSEPSTTSKSPATSEPSANSRSATTSRFLATPKPSSSPESSTSPAPPEPQAAQTPAKTNKPCGVLFKNETYKSYCLTIIDNGRFIRKTCAIICTSYESGLYTCVDDHFTPSLPECALSLNYDTTTTSEPSSSTESSASPALPETPAENDGSCGASFKIGTYLQCSISYNKDTFEMKICGIICEGGESGLYSCENDQWTPALPECTQSSNYNMTAPPGPSTTAKSATISEPSTTSKPSLTTQSSTSPPCRAARLGDSFVCIYGKPSNCTISCLFGKTGQYTCQNDHWEPPYPICPGPPTHATTTIPEPSTTTKSTTTSKSTITPEPSTFPEPSTTPEPSTIPELSTTPESATTPNPTTTPESSSTTKSATSPAQTKPQGKNAGDGRGYGGFHVGAQGGFLGGAQGGLLGGAQGGFLGGAQGGAQGGGQGGGQGRAQGGVHGGARGGVHGGARGGFLLG